MRDRLEKTVEDAVCDWARSKGFLVYKLSFLGRRGAPDRLFISPFGDSVYIELKRRGKLAKGLQLKLAREWWERGVPVYTNVDTEKVGVAILSQFCTGVGAP